MATTLAKASKGKADELPELLDRLVKAKENIENLLRKVDEVLQSAPDHEQRRAFGNAGQESDEIAPPRPSPLDGIKQVMAATADLRGANGNLSAGRVAKLFGISVSKLAGWLGRSRQALTKTPDADSLQTALGYFERVSRMRLVTESDAEFRKWLRTPHELLENASPLELLAKGEWQVMADYVDDALAGAPT